MRSVNQQLAQHVYFSTSRLEDYDKFMKPEQFTASRRTYDFFLDHFMSPGFFEAFAALGAHSDRLMSLAIASNFARA